MRMITGAILVHGAAVLLGFASIDSIMVIPSAILGFAGIMFLIFGGIADSWEKKKG